MTDTNTQAQEFIDLLKEAGLSDERIDYYVDKLALGTFDVKELETELSERSKDLTSVIKEGEDLLSEMEADTKADEAVLPQKMATLAEDYKAEMDATALSSKTEAEQMEANLYKFAESKQKKQEETSIAKIKSFLQKKK